MCGLQPSRISAECPVVAAEATGVRVDMQHFLGEPGSSRTPLLRQSGACRTPRSGPRWASSFCGTQPRRPAGPEDLPLDRRRKPCGGDVAVEDAVNRPSMGRSLHPHRVPGRLRATVLAIPVRRHAHLVSKPLGELDSVTVEVAPSGSPGTRESETVSSGPSVLKPVQKADAKATGGTKRRSRQPTAATPRRMCPCGWP